MELVGVCNLAYLFLEYSFLTSFRLLKGEMGLKSRTPKRHIEGTYLMHIQNFNFLAEFGGEIGKEQHFLKVKKERNPHISLPN